MNTVPDSDVKNYTSRATVLAGISRGVVMLTYRI